MALTMPMKAAAAIHHTFSAASRATPPAALDGVEDEQRSPAAEAIAAEGDGERAEGGAREPRGRHRADLTGLESALGEVETEQDAGERRRDGAHSGARQDEDARAAERHCREAWRRYRPG